MFLLISAIFSQDFEEIDSNLLNQNFEDTIIPLNKLNTEYPKNLEVLIRLSAAHHLLSEKVYDEAMDIYHLDKSLHYITEAIKLIQQMDKFINGMHWHMVKRSKMLILELKSKVLK